MFILLPRFRVRISVLAIPAALLMLWCEGYAAFFVLMLSALLHELGHLLCMSLLGYGIRRIDILPMGALIVCPEGISHRDELKIALSGPLASLLLLVTAVAWFCINKSVLALFVAVVNFALCVFNLLPIEKSDGGKALYSLLAAKGINEKKARSICLALSVIFKILFSVVAVACIYLTGCNLGAMLLLCALLLQL